MTIERKTKWLRIDIQSFWHAGTGKSSGAYLDAITDKDRAGFPFLPGKHVKGLLRNAFRHARALGRFEGELAYGDSDALEVLIFGSQSGKELRIETVPGMLRVSNGELSPDEKAALNSDKTLKPHLYFEMFSTAIDANGVAASETLRGIEVCAPVVLCSRLELGLTGVDSQYIDAQQNFLKQDSCWDWLEELLPLLDAVGANRTRGLGEALFELSDEPHHQPRGQS